MDYCLVIFSALALLLIPLNLMRPGFGGFIIMFFWQRKRKMEDHEKQNKLIRRIHVGMTIAAVFIGLVLALSAGADYDDDRDLFLYIKAKAEAGDIQAQSALGEAYWFGQGTQQNDRLARIWWEKSAKRGDADAQYNLGALYQNKNDTTAISFGLKKRLNKETRMHKII